MTTLQLQFDHRPHSHQGLATTSPANSPPRIQRPASQASVHLPPSQVLQSPAPNHEQFSAQPYPQLSYRQYQPSNLSLPSPQHHFMYPNTAPPMAFYPTNSAYDPRSAQMMRTISHAHPLNSANDQTASSRYSQSPHTGGADGPASASYQWQMGPPALSTPAEERHINPSVFNNNSDYPMSRSTSGASEADAQRLLTPHLEYREQLSPAAADLRKVSDSLGGYSRYGLDRYTPAPQGYPQPQFWGRETPAGFQHLESCRNNPQQQQQQQPQQQQEPLPENDYERERQELISGNRKLMETLGLGGQPRPVRQMSTSDARSRKITTPKKRTINYDGLVRSSPRIASQHRNVSYMDLDGMPGSEHSDDSYSDDDVIYEEDDFRPAKRGRGHKQMRKTSYAPRARKPMVELSLWGLLQPYPQIPELFPLFYYTLNNDLSINHDSVPLIGSIPSTTTPLEKADVLQNFFHRGRRVLNQLDCFTSRCDRKYEGPEERWVELEHNTRIAIRDVRRKIVERCENYKYTRRDILDKNVGKNKWPPIESGMIEWKYGVTVGDPAGDLSNVTLTLPTPPPGALNMQHQQQQMTPDFSSQRTIRPMPSRSRLVSSTPRSVTVNMEMGTPATAAYPSTSSTPFGGHYGAAAPTYSEDLVPMTVQMPISANFGPPPFTSTLSPAPAADPRASVGAHTPLVANSSSPLFEAAEPATSEPMPTASSALTSAGTGTWTQGEAGQQRGEKRERSGSVESDASE